MCSPLQKKAAVDKIINSVLPITRIIVPIAETAGKKVDRIVNEYRLRDMEEASTTVAEEESLIECSLPCAMTPPKIPFYFESHEGPFVSVVVAASRPVEKPSKSRYRKHNIRYLTLFLTAVLIIGAAAVVI